MQIEIIKPTRVFDAVEAWRLSRDQDADYKATDVIAVDVQFQKCHRRFYILRI